MTIKVVKTHAFYDAKLKLLSIVLIVLLRLCVVDK